MQSESPSQPGSDRPSRSKWSLWLLFFLKPEWLLGPDSGRPHFFKEGSWKACICIAVPWESMSVHNGSIGIGFPNPAAARLPTRPPAFGSWLPVSYTHLRAHETDSYLVCRL